MNTEQQIKQVLVNLAIKDELPLDVNELSPSVFGEPIMKIVCYTDCVDLGYEDEFTFKCYDGVAIGENGKFRVTMSYPLKSELTIEQVFDAMVYRYGKDERHWPHFGIQFDDIMMKFGETIQTKTLNK